MCGIAGIFRANGLNSADAAALPQMLEALDHRGPDGRGRHVDEKSGLALGHTRLSIIDLTETGAQPIVSRSGKRALAANGEFYDYKLARTRLTCDGERFATRTDSEIALKLYDKHGLDFVRHLRGEFAFALYDGDRDRLILVRDRFGVRPLFYRLAEDSLFFGSEIKALLAHPDVPAQLSRRAALHQMMQTYAPGMTAFEDISGLLPGHMLVIERRGDRLEVERIRYWDMEFPRVEDYDPDPIPQLYVERLTDELIDAVRVRLEADVPVGCYLSGGIDSCSMLGLSTALSQAPVKAYTIAFENDAYDEADLAKEMANGTRADQEVMLLSGPELYGDSFRRTVWHAERTFYNTLSVAKWHMSRRVRDSGFKVVVTGEGADELFAGYPFLVRDYLLHGDDVPGDRNGLSDQLARRNNLFKGAILSEEQVSHPAMDELCGFTPSWIQPWLLTLSGARELFAPEVASELAEYDPIRAIAEGIDPAQLQGRHPLDKAQYTWIKTMLEGQILSWGGDRVDMAHSMESRPAFLDHKLAAFAATVPPSLRIRDGIEKWVLREAMRGVLPERLYKKSKFAFMAPPSRTEASNRREAEALLEDALSDDVVEDAALFDRQKVKSFLEAWRREEDPTKSRRHDIVLNHLLGIHLVHRYFVAGEPAPAG